MLSGKIDLFNSIHIAEDSIDPKIFEKQMEESLEKWEKEKKIIAVWLTLSIKNSDLIREASEKFKFELHHTSKEHIVMNKWIE